MKNEKRAISKSTGNLFDEEQSHNSEWCDVTSEFQMRCPLTAESRKLIWLLIILFQPHRTRLTAAVNNNNKNVELI